MIYPRLEWKLSPARAVVTLAFGVTALLLIVSQSAALAQPFNTSALDLEANGKLTPLDGVGHSFGLSVAVSGDVAVVGAPDSIGSGSAHIFARDERGTWRQVAKLTVPEGPTRFGASVAISGDTLIVGAPDSPFNDRPGAVYVFQRDSGGPDTWRRVAELTVGGVPSVEFGFSVAISGDTVIVGSTGAFISGAGPIFWGAAYVFARNFGGPDMWGEVASLTASDGRDEDAFGHAVSISGDAAIVGAPNANDGNGAAYIFARDQGGADRWGEVATLNPPVQGGGVGNGVAISGDAAIVATYSISTSFPTVFIYSRDSGGSNLWREVFQRRFFGVTGVSIAIDGDVAIVGSPTEDGRRERTGALHVLRRVPEGWHTWQVVTKLAAPDGSYVDLFGYRVSIDQSRVLSSAVNAGVAYICELGEGSQSACIGPPLVVDNQLRMSDVTTACCDNSEMAITATFTNVNILGTNVNDATIWHPFIETVELSGGNVLRNADNGPGGTGSILTPDVGDGVLSPGESVTVTFIISLASRHPFRFLVSMLGGAAPP